MSDLQPLEIIPVETAKSKREFEGWMRSKQNKFNPTTYNLAKNNCNNFASSVISFLANGARIPKYILALPMKIALAPRAATMMPLVEGITKAMKEGTQLDPSIVARIPRSEMIVPMVNALLRSLGAQVSSPPTHPFPSSLPPSSRACVSCLPPPPPGPLPLPPWPAPSLH